MHVIDAHVRRAVDRDGLRCVEVEVQTDSPEAESVLAYFSSSLDNDYDLQAVVRNDANTAIDWYDNNMHQAFENITNELFENENVKTDWGARESFKEQVLAHGDVRDGLARQLSQE
ncbi:hypothetical protein ACFO9Q_06475 [Paenibacillus sp. GCM10023252]|uniref:hypothetical protein n=1 Tax=Paenibacillus sp. GCM10023252 TaxID=3252649 RepID=UPI003615FCFB